MFGVLLNNNTFFDGFKTLDEAKSFAFKLAQGIPDFKSVKVVEIK